MDPGKYRVQIYCEIAHPFIGIVEIKTYYFHFRHVFGLVNKQQRLVAGSLCCSIRKTTKHYIRQRCLLVAVLIRKSNRNLELECQDGVQRSIWTSEVYLSFSDLNS